MSGLPDEWRLVLESSDISKDEVIKNVEAVINALAYQFKQEAVPTAQDMLDMDAMLKDSKDVVVIPIYRIFHSRRGSKRILSWFERDSR